MVQVHPGPQIERPASGPDSSYRSEGHLAGETSQGVHRGEARAQSSALGGGVIGDDPLVPEMDRNPRKVHLDRLDV